MTTRSPARNLFPFLTLSIAIGLVGSAYAKKVKPAQPAPAASQTVDAALPNDLPSFKARLLAATTNHLDRLIGPDGKVTSLKGKSADANTAFAFYLTYEVTGNQKYRAAGVQLADVILKAMRAAKFGVLFIKEKEKSTGEEIAGGGPPAFGWQTATLGYIFHQEGNRPDDLNYVATILDQFPWNEQGWWSADIDVKTGVSKQPLTKPSPINKNAAIAMAAGMVSVYVKEIDPALSARLRHKADQCINQQIIPAQQADGYWHYGLTGRDPKNKDVLGYFMLTTGVLIQLQEFNASFRTPALNAALDHAGAFALNRIAPMTDPNHGSAPPDRKTPNTPSHYNLAEDTKRGFQLGTILIGQQHYIEGARIMDRAMKYFPFGDGGAEGAHAVYPTALMLRLLQHELAKRP